MNSRLLEEAADRFGTPCYVFDTDAFADRIGWIGKLLGSRARLCYAMKANPFFTQAAAGAADGLEVCSPGEYSICRRAGIAAEKIVLSGVNKEPSEIEEVMRDRGAGVYTAESLNQLELLEACARKAGLAAASVPVLLRVTSGNQFGMDEEDLCAAVSSRERYGRLDLIGLQHYSGTQKKKADKIRKELSELDRLCLRLKEEHGFAVRELEYGPGFYIPYFQGEEEPDEEALLKDFRKLLEALTFQGRITLEMGRFLAAPCGSYLTRIADRKTIRGQNYCIVDGGINHVNYYGQAMAMKIPPHRLIRRGGECACREERWTVCGSLCTSGDVLVKNLPLPGAAAGDLLVFDRIGAYSVTEGIYLFLSRKLPKVLFYSEQGGLRLVRRDLATDRLNAPEEWNTNM